MNKTKVMLAFAAGVASGFVGGKYLVYGPDSGERRRQLHDYMLAVENDVRKKMRRAGTMTEDAYRVIVDEVADGYASMHRISQDMAHTIAEKLKSRFAQMEAVMRESAEEADRKTGASGNR